MRSNLEYMLLPQPGDRQLLGDLSAKLEALDDQQLIDTYNRTDALGLVGARAQALHAFALGRICLRRFGESPVALDHNVILRLRGQVRLEDGRLVFLQPELAAPQEPAPDAQAIQTS